MTHKLEKSHSLSIKKHNTLTDGYIPNIGQAVLPDKILNVFYWLYEKHGVKFTVSLPELRRLLDLKSIKDDDRIYAAISLLQIPLQIRDFSYQGKSVEWISAPFLSRAISWKEHQKHLEVHLDEMIIEAMKQKGGYTPLELSLCNQFKTKYGLKLYEMYKRYYNLPNREGKGVGRISKSIGELNAMLGTSYKHQSALKKGIDRGLKEIEKIAQEQITCFFNKHKKTFEFCWYQRDKYPKLRIPYKRIEEFIDWYLSKQDSLKIKSMPKYRQTLRKKIIDDEFVELDVYYKGLMKYKYNLSPDKYIINGRYQNF